MMSANAQTKFKRGGVKFKRGGVKSCFMYFSFYLGCRLFLDE